MKFFINIFKLIIFIFYLLQLLPLFLTILIVNVCVKILSYKPEWVVKINTHFIYYSSNILLRNHSNKFIIYFILKLQTLVLKLGINTGLTLCRSQNIHAGQGLLLKFQAYPEPLELYNIYFAIWFTLIQESKFLNNDVTQIFICTIYSSPIWDSDSEIEVGDYKYGLCNLISDVKTSLNLKCSSFWTLHSNFTWSDNVTIIDYIKAIIPYHQKLIQARNVSNFQTPWVNEVHVTSWKVSDQLNKKLIKREGFKHSNTEIKD